MTYTPPRDVMADAARLLAAQPSTCIPLLVQALVAIKGQGPAAVVAEHILKEVKK